MVEKMVQLLSKKYSPETEMGPGVIPMTTGQILQLFKEIMEVSQESAVAAMEAGGFQLILIQEEGQIIGYRWLLKPIQYAQEVSENLLLES